MTEQRNPDMATMAQHLSAVLGGGEVSELRRLSGGANMETWALVYRGSDGQSCPLILRRLPAAVLDSATPDSTTRDDQPGEISLPSEAELLKLAEKYAVSVPSVKVVLQPEHQLGAGYVMSRERGEALPFRILADEQFADARTKLAFQCGQTLARIHQMSLDELPDEMVFTSLSQRLERFQSLMDKHGNVSPIHQLALNWLRNNQPDNPRRTLVHGDFRNGNLLVDEQGLSAVLDWELAHIGDPVEDLGYFCTNVWRFGHIDKPAGGFGSYEQLLQGYRSVMGDAPPLQALHYWEVYSTLNWGLACLIMLDMYRTGKDPSIERLAIGRRMSESEIDLLLMLEDKIDGGDNE